jgi:hypothetical protein
VPTYSEPAGRRRRLSAPAPPRSLRRLLTHLIYRQRAILIN